jgi:hypothetical protein
MQSTSQRPQRPLICTSSFSDLYTDARLHGYQGPTRTVRLPGAAATGGGAIAKSEDGERCVVTGKECVCSFDEVPGRTAIYLAHWTAFYP